jgi:Na+/H+-dicarboxylate symporter
MMNRVIVLVFVGLVTGHVSTSVNAASSKMIGDAIIKLLEVIH